MAVLPSCWLLSILDPLASTFPPTVNINSFMFPSHSTLNLISKGVYCKWDVRPWTWCWPYPSIEHGLGLLEPLDMATNQLRAKLIQHALASAKQCVSYQRYQLDPLGDSRRGATPIYDIYEFISRLVRSHGHAQPRTPQRTMAIDFRVWVLFLFENEIKDAAWWRGGK